jgi:Tfp pilus assembly protein PilN
MIKINLSTAKRQMDMTNVGGFDFTKIKIKLVAIAIAILYIPDFVLVPMWEEEMTQLNMELTAKRQELGALRSKVSKTSALEKQIRELKAQEENLSQKLVAVKQAISEKRNPSSLLLYIAKNIPKELWIKELVLENQDLVIRGEALDYTSVGNFINSLKSSVFIKEANIISTKSEVRENDKKRIESFEVKFLIGKFEQ